VGARGLFRTADGLSALLEQLGARHGRGKPLITVGRLIAGGRFAARKAAAGHFRLDYRGTERFALGSGGSWKL
jgi:hypothetical protein